MRDKSIIRGDMYKKLRQLGMNLPKAVKTVKRHERGDISIIEILEECGTVEYINSYDRWHCDLCDHDNETIDYRIVRPSGLEMLVTCYLGCTGMSIEKIEKTEKKNIVSNNN